MKITNDISLYIFEYVHNIRLIKLLKNSVWLIVCKKGRLWGLHNRSHWHCYEVRRIRELWSMHVYVKRRVPGVLKQPLPSNTSFLTSPRVGGRDGQWLLESWLQIQQVIRCFRVAVGDKPEHKVTGHYRRTGNSLTKDPSQNQESTEVLSLDFRSSKKLQYHVCPSLLYKFGCFVNDTYRTVISLMAGLTSTCLADPMSGATRSRVAVMGVKMASPVGGAGSGEEVNNRGWVDGPPCCGDGGRICCRCSWVPLELFQALFLQLFWEQYNFSPGKYSWKKRLETACGFCIFFRW